MTSLALQWHTFLLILQQFQHWTGIVPLYDDARAAVMGTGETR